jgi:CheY-like chemotaxis protein
MSNSKRILVAEDNAALALVVRFHLERAGFHVTSARNGREAWNLLQHEDFDLLITDQQMPELSGCEVCHLMRREPRLAHLPVILLTAKGLELEHNWVREELKVQVLLPKPFSPRELVEKAENCLAASASVSV